MLVYENEVVQKDMQDLISRKTKWGKLKNKTVLITGASGMLATYIVYTLMTLNLKDNFNIKIICLVRNEEKAKAKFSSFIYKPNFELLVQDVTNKIDFNEKIDFIIHAAGNASPKYILLDPVGIIKANTLGTLNVLELARKNKVENVLYLSTREIYGKNISLVDNITENDYGIVDCLDLRSCYPESKRVAETMLKSYFYQYNIPFTIARLAHAYGPGMNIDNDGRVMSDFISDVVNNRNIVLKSDGSAVRAFCYITDAVFGLFKVLLEGKIGEAYNIANENEPLMIRDVAKQLVANFAEKDLEVVYDLPKEKSAGYSKMGRTKLDTRKLKDLGWECKIELKDGLEKTVKSF